MRFTSLLKKAQRQEAQAPKPSRTHCKRNHDLTLPGAVYFNSRGSRCCRECHRQAKRDSLARKKNLEPGNWQFNQCRRGHEYNDWRQCAACIHLRKLKAMTDPNP